MKDRQAKESSTPCGKKTKAMNTQEIYQNMTKGEWKMIEAEDWFTAGIDDTNGHPILWVSDEDENEGIPNPTNVAAIVSAVNSTYGRGINPEIIFKAMELLTASMHKFRAIGGLSHLDFAQEIKEALTAAKL